MGNFIDQHTLYDFIILLVASTSRAKFSGPGSRMWIKGINSNDQWKSTQIMDMNNREE